MRHFKSLHSLIVVLALGIVFLLPGCSDKAPPVYEDNGTTEDKGAGEGLTKDNAMVPDKVITPDQPPTWPDIWPDTNVADTVDQYVGAPFGCKTDTDCFGQKCCKTPWGVKLCAPSCGK